MSLDEGDQLGWARITNGSDEVIFVTENGQALRFNENKIRAMGRQAAGVSAIKLKKEDAVTSMDVVEKDGSLLVVTSTFFFQAEDGIRYLTVTGVQTCALPI